MQIKLTLTFLVPFLLIGCSTTKYNEIKVQDTKIVYQSIPEELLSPCQATTPISKHDYMLFKPHEREEYLTNYTISLYGDIKKCNVKLSKIKELNNRKQE